MAAIADPTSFKTVTYPKSLARRLGLTGFGHWWLRELAAAMPVRLRTALERRRARPVLAFDGNTATLWRPTTNGRMQMSEAARIALDGDPKSVTATGRAALAPLVRAGNGAPAPVIVTLSPRASLRKTLTLPMALEDHLHQALAYDLDRHTPFKPEELYFDAVIVDRDSAHNTLRIDLAAARRALVDIVLRQAESFGARVIAVTVDAPAAAAASRINLLPEDRRPAGSGWARWQVVLPALVLVVAAFAALLLPIWQERDEAIALIQTADQARQRASVSDALRTELERRIGEYNFALERKYAFPGAVQVLDDVTRILPDDTWLTQLELHTMRGKDAQREVTLRGESANAGRLVALLENSKLFTQAAPRSPTTKIQPGPGEIFDVSAHLAPQPVPTAMPLDLTAPPARAPVPAARRAPPSKAADTPNSRPPAAPANPAAPDAADARPPAPAGAGSGPGASAARGAAPGAAARKAGAQRAATGNGPAGASAQASEPLPPAPAGDTSVPPAAAPSGVAPPVAPPEPEEGAGGQATENGG
jgi:general secretion pathway protein L